MDTVSWKKKSNLDTRWEEDELLRIEQEILDVERRR